MIQSKHQYDLLRQILHNSLAFESINNQNGEYLSYNPFANTLQILLGLNLTDLCIQGVTQTSALMTILVSIIFGVYWLTDSIVFFESQSLLRRCNICRSVYNDNALFCHQSPCIRSGQPEIQGEDQRYYLFPLPPK